MVSIVSSLYNIIKLVLSPIIFIFKKIKPAIDYIDKNSKIEKRNKQKRENFISNQKRLNRYDDRII